MAILDTPEVEPMTVRASKKPKLPVEWLRASFVGSSAFVLYALSMIGLPLLGAAEVMHGGLPSPLKALLVVPLLIVAGQGLHLLAWVGHEGFHFNLARSKRLSAFLGVLFTSPIAFFSTVGEHSIHWGHHKFTNATGDRQTELYPPYRTLWTRLLFARVKTEQIYIQNVLAIAFGEFSAPMAFDRDTMRRWARLNLALSAAWCAFYVAVFVSNPRAGLLYIAVPHLVAFTLSSLRPYVEHADTSTDLFHCARSHVSPLLTALFFFNNYHLEHHLYPKVPCYRLRRVRRLLIDSGVYAEVKPPSASSVREAVGYASARYSYPGLTPAPLPSTSRS